MCTTIHSSVHIDSNERIRFESTGHIRRKQFPRVSSRATNLESRQLLSTSSGTCVRSLDVRMAEEKGFMIIRGFSSPGLKPVEACHVTQRRWKTWPNRCETNPKHLASSKTKLEGIYWKVDSHKHQPFF